MLNPHELSIGKALGGTFIDDAECRWAENAWVGVAKALDVDELEMQEELREAAYRMFGVVTIVIDARVLSDNGNWELDLERWADALDMEAVQVAVDAEREGINPDIEDGWPEEWDTGEGLYELMLRGLVRSRRRPVMELLRPALGGERALAESLMTVQKRLFWPPIDRPNDDPGPAGQWRWDLIDLPGPFEWSYDGESVSATPAETWELDWDARLARWVRAGCLWVGPEWG